MILLVLAIICLGAAAFIVGELITQPAQERTRFFKRVATYGERPEQIVRVTEESLKTRVAMPIVERLARFVLRINPKTTIDGVAYKLVSAGHKLIIAGLIMMVIGSTIIRKIVTVKG